MICGYIEVGDGYVPTCPPPTIEFWNTREGSDVWMVRVFDHHGDSHTFARDLTRQDADAVAQILIRRIMRSDTKPEIIRYAHAEAEA